MKMRYTELKISTQQKHNKQIKIENKIAKLMALLYAFALGSGLLKDQVSQNKC